MGLWINQGKYKEKKKPPPKTTPPASVNLDLSNSYHPNDEEDADSEEEDDNDADGKSINTNQTKSKSKNSVLKGIRRDINAYQEFKDKKHYDSWIKSTRATARLHRISPVLDKDYKPIGEEAVDEF